MSNKTVEIKPESKEGDNIFDKYFAFFEDVKLKYYKDEIVDYSPLINALTILERNLIDINQQGVKKQIEFSLYNNATTHLLKEWFPILQYFYKNQDFVNFLAYNLLGFGLIFNDGVDLSKVNIYNAFFSPSIDYNLIFDELTYFSQDEKKGNRKSRSFGNFIVVPHHSLPGYLVENQNEHVKDEKELENINFKIRDRFEKNIFEIHNNELNGSIDIEYIRKKAKSVEIDKIFIDYSYHIANSAITKWEIVIKTKENHPNASQFFNLLFSVSTAIELISDDEIEVFLADWGNGSKWAKLVVQFKGFLAKEETKEILHKAKKAAEAELFDIRITNVEKSVAETEKIKKETANMVSEEMANETNYIDLERKKLELLEKAVDVENKILDGKSKRIELATKLSNLIKDGIIQNDSDIQIEINNLLFFGNKDDQLNGVALNIISEKESIQPKAELPESKTTDDK
jgi:hypothetical protein